MADGAPQRLEEVLADFREDAKIADRIGDGRVAELLTRMVDRVAKAAADYLVFLAESEARLRSGKSIDWLRHRFPEWERQGHAFRKGRQRFYRTLIVPIRANVSAAYRAGRGRSA